MAEIETRRRVFDGFTQKAVPCPVCLELAVSGVIQPRAVMPLPPFPARLRADGRPCCRDCQATETTMAFEGQHHEFGPARLTIANERIEGMSMPFGLMENCGLCQLGFLLPCSIDGLDHYCEWLEANNIPNSLSCEAFSSPRKV